MATFALFSWPIISLAFFGMLGQARGLIWSVAVGYLILPEAYGFDVPALPPYDKYIAIAVAALLGVFMTRSKNADQSDVVSVEPAFQRIQMGLLVLIVLVSPVMTMLTNPEALIDGPNVRPGLTYRDVISRAVYMLSFFTPLFLAWRVLVRPEHHRELLIAIVGLSVAYTFPVLFEWRMSPQLNIWIYGYFQHDWGQHLRGGGFRPIVFLQHGLVVGFLLMTATLSAFALSRDSALPRGVFILLGCWMLLVLFMSRNFGSTFLALSFAPLVLSLGRKMQVRVAMIIAVVFLSYPLMKYFHLSPEDPLFSLFDRLSPQRAASLGFRLRNEEALLARAMEKPLFGWGGWARSHIFNQWGRDMTIIDGTWIAVLGQRGWLGFFSYFGFIVMPIFFLGRAMRRKPLSPAIAGMTLITGVNLVDLIPNSTMSPLGLMMLGSMAAFVQFDLKRQGDEVPGDAEEPARRRNRYTRFASENGASSEAFSRYRRS